MSNYSHIIKLYTQRSFLFRLTHTDSGYLPLQRVDYAEVTSVLHWATFM